MPRKVTAGAVLATALVLASPAAAKQKPITGSAPKGFTVIALADSGRAATAVAKPAFKLVPPAKTVTLHLRDRSGVYAGPFVAGGKGAKVIVGVKGGAVLGKLRLKRGFAVPAKPLPARALDTKRSARASRGVPLGAGKLGLVAVPATGASGPGRDQDLDGIPGAFDVDDDGDLKLDNVEPKASASNHTTVFPDSLHPWWVINAGLEVSFILEDKGVTHGAAGYALNINAAGPFAGDSTFKTLQDTVMKDRGTLLFAEPSGDSELDCGDAAGGLSYCRPGGTGFAHNRTQKYPGDFDTDGNGLGSMPPMALGEVTEGQDGLTTFTGVSPDKLFGLAPMAGDGEIRSGDTFVRHQPDGSTYPVTLNTVFETVPALAGWSDGIRTQQISYPVLRGGEGSESTPFEVSYDDAQQAYVVTLSAWRPQRRPISSAEGTGWIDQGGLTYSVVGKTVEQSRTVFSCPSARVDDAGPDQPSSPANTIKLTVNLSECLRPALGINWQDHPVPVDLFVSARSAYGDVAEGGGFAFKPKSFGAAAADFSGTWKFPAGSPGPTLDWTITANQSAPDTTRFGIIAYSPRAIQTGTSPAGWTCKLGAAGDNPMWECSGATLHAGETVSGSVSLNQDGADNMPLDMLICNADNFCKGFGMTQQK